MPTANTIRLETYEAHRILAGEMPLDEQTRLDRQSVLDLKSGAAPRYDCRSCEPVLHAQVDETRVISFVASDESVNRTGDKVMVAGWDLANFKRNPIILWNHNMTMDPKPPIGRAVSIRKGRNKAGEKALLVDIEFASADVNPFADTIFKLVRDGYLNAVSVGFIPKRVTVPQTDDEAAKMGLGPFGVRIDAAELLEISVVDIPRLPSAVRNSLNAVTERGVITEEEADRFVAALAGEEVEYHDCVTGAFGDRVATAIDSMLGGDSALTPREMSEMIAASLSERSISSQLEPEDGGSSRKEPASCVHDQALSAATTALIHSVAEQTTALRQLLDAVTDMARRVVDLSGEIHGGARVPATPDAVPPEGESQPGQSELDADSIARAVARIVEASREPIQKET